MIPKASLFNQIKSYFSSQYSVKKLCRYQGREADCKAGLRGYAYGLYDDFNYDSATKNPDDEHPADATRKNYLYAIGNLKSEEDNWRYGDPLLMII